MIQELIDDLPQVYMLCAGLSIIAILLVGMILTSGRRPK